MADEKGYIYKFWIYGGVKVAKDKRSAAPFDVVMDLLEDIPQGNNIILADSFYGSFELAEALSKKGWRFIIACHGDRKSAHFNDYLARQLKKGEWRCMTNDELGILAMSFYDVKKVIVFFEKAQCSPLIESAGSFLHKLCKRRARRNSQRKKEASACCRVQSLHAWGQSSRLLCKYVFIQA